MRHGRIHRRGYSLANIFMLLAALAVVFALARSVLAEGGLRRKLSWGLAAASAGCGITGAIAGGVVSYSQRRKLGVLVLGSAVGFATGLCAGALLCLRAQSWLYLLGAALLIVVALFLRLAQRSGR